MFTLMFQCTSNRENEMEQERRGEGRSGMRRDSESREKRRKCSLPESHP